MKLVKSCAFWSVVGISLFVGALLISPAIILENRIGKFEISPLGKDPLSLRLSNATVLITRYVGEKGNSTNSILKRCNGINMGDGLIITNAHCVEKDSWGHLVWFGEIYWPGSTAEGPEFSELTIAANKMLDLKPPVPGGGEAVLDVAAFQLSVDDIKATNPKFLDSPVEISANDIWCNSSGSCNHSPQSEAARELTPLSVAQIWSVPPYDELNFSISMGRVDGGYQYRRGIRTLSRNNPTKFCASRTHTGVDIDIGSLTDSCADVSSPEDWTPRISTFGYIHDCDTMAGASGAPVFRQSDLDRFFAGAVSIPLMGIHRAGSKDVGNCLIPASLIKNEIIN